MGSRCLQTTQTQQLAAPCTPEQVLQLAGPLGQRRHWDQAEDGTSGVRQACGTSPARGPYSPVCSFLSPRFLPRVNGDHTSHPAGLCAESKHQIQGVKHSAGLGLHEGCVCQATGRGPVPSSVSLGGWKPHESLARAALA